MYRHAQCYKNNNCHPQVLKTAASFYGHAKLFQCQRWFAMILNEQYYCKKLTCQLQILLSKFWHKGTKTEETTWMIGTPRSRWKTHVGSARASVGCRAPPSLLHQGDRLNNYISLKVVLLNAPQFQWEAKQRLSLGVCSELLDASKIEARLAGRVRGRKLKTQTTSLPSFVPCQKTMWYSLINFQAVISLSQIQ